MPLPQEQWEQLVAEWRRSGKTATRFAQERGLAATALRYWINRPPTKGSRPKAVPTVANVAERPSLATPLARVVRAGEAPPSAVRIIVGHAAIVIEPGFDAVHLRAVVRALSELE